MEKVNLYQYNMFVLSRNVLIEVLKIYIFAVNLKKSKTWNLPYAKILADHFSIYAKKLSDFDQI